MAAEDPVVSAWFGIEFQGQVKGAFRECTGLDSENDGGEYKASGQKGDSVTRKMPERMKWNNITLKRGIVTDMAMWQWRRLVERGQIDDARKNGFITMYNQEGKAIVKWSLVRAWPSKLTGPSANATNNELGVEELELTHEGCQRTQ